MNDINDMYNKGFNHGIIFTLFMVGVVLLSIYFQEPL
jgi:hypothetical protein